MKNYIVSSSVEKLIMKGTLLMTFPVEKMRNEGSV
jgi:hypothetical protein